MKIWSKNLDIFQVTSFKQNWSTVRDKLEKNLKAVYQMAESLASLWLSWAEKEAQNIKFTEFSN